jgi:hypothetical protein
MSTPPDRPSPSAGSWDIPLLLVPLPLATVVAWFALSAATSNGYALPWVVFGVIGVTLDALVAYFVSRRRRSRAASLVVAGLSGLAGPAFVIGMSYFIVRVYCAGRGCFS